jgi:hypothetical protein
MQYAKSVYRVLLTRGMKGCYVYFVDKETERYFKSRIEKYAIPLPKIRAADVREQYDAEGSEQ